MMYIVNDTDNDLEVYLPLDIEIEAKCCFLAINLPLITAKSLLEPPNFFPKLHNELIPT